MIQLIFENYQCLSMFLYVRFDEVDRGLGHEQIKTLMDELS